MKREMHIAHELERIADLYPGAEAEVQRRGVARIAFNLHLVATAIPRGGSVVDIGGGLGLFSPGAAALGYRSILIDDFRDHGNVVIAEDVFQKVHRSLGVTIESRDVIAEGINIAANSMDAVTTFDSMEHWHHSPRSLFRQLSSALKPGGLWVIGVPNCVNLRKRITVPCGIGKWSSMVDWYEEGTFRGHVREPDVDDLRYIARDLGLIDCKVLGRNWLGYGSHSASIRAVTSVIDRLLWFSPSLCSNIYLIGRKRQTP